MSKRKHAHFTAIERDFLQSTEGMATGCGYDWNIEIYTGIQKLFYE